VNRLSADSAVKSQYVRLADVVLIGPMMIWGGARAIPERPLLGSLLTLMGVGTIVLNGVNFRRIQHHGFR